MKGQLEGEREVLLLTNDRDCLQRAAAEKLPAMRIHDFAIQHCATWTDSLAAEGETGAGGGGEDASLRGADGAFAYPEHLDEAALQASPRIPRRLHCALCEAPDVAAAVRQ